MLMKRLLEHLMCSRGSRGSVTVGLFSEPNTGLGKLAGIAPSRRASQTTHAQPLPLPQPPPLPPPPLRPVLQPELNEGF